MSNNDTGWYGGRRLDLMGPNELSKIRSVLKKQEEDAASIENYVAAAKYRDKGREIQRHLNESLEDCQPEPKSRRSR